MIAQHFLKGVNFYDERGDKGVKSKLPVFIRMNTTTEHKSLFLSGLRI